MRLKIHPVTRKVQRSAVAKWHSHHKPTIGETIALGGFVDDALVAVIVMGVPVSPALQDGKTWEVTRLAVGPAAPRFAASRLLGAAGRVMDAAGVERQISYTRIDENGTCYKAAGWVRTGTVKPDTHTHGNRATFLPGVWQHSTDAIERVRWERGEYVRNLERAEAAARGVSVARLREVAREALARAVEALNVKEPG